jgi:hypothetical protein
MIWGKFLAVTKLSIHVEKLEKTKHFFKNKLTIMIFKRNNEKKETRESFYYMASGGFRFGVF